MTNESPYDALGVTPDMSLAEIKVAFRKLAFLHHPDRIGGDGELFKKISSAYAYLEKRHVQQPKRKTEGPDMSKHGNSKGVKGFFEYDEETRRWYSHLDIVDYDYYTGEGFVTPTQYTPPNEEEFQEKLRKLKESRIGKAPNSDDFKDQFRPKSQRRNNR